MKSKTGKHLSLCLLVFLLGIFILSISAGAEEQIVLSSFEELKEWSSDSPTRTTASLLCTVDDLVFSEDFEIPAGTVITFRFFTVSEGITLTVMENAEIQTYGFAVEGNLINRGKIVQQDLSAEWAGNERRIFALIPGHVDNRGEMLLTDVFGRRNINRFGGKLIMNETEAYEDMRRIAFDDEAPAPVTEPVNTPAPAEKNPVQKVFGILEEVLPKLAFILVLVCLFAVIKVGISSSRDERRRKPGAAGSYSAAGQSVIYDYSGEDHFQRNKRKRIEQLDQWLKTGLIDRKEYNELKRRYQEDR